MITKPKIFIFCALLLMSLSSSAKSGKGPKMTFSFTVVSLNLHGFHPMGELPRFWQDREGKVTRANSDIFFFTEEEIVRGHERRINQLAKDFNSLNPDIILLQEVAAGPFRQERKTCEDFNRQFATPVPWENTALQLSRSLQQTTDTYTTHLACRGNVGWFTGESNFKDRRIVVFPQEGAAPQVIHDFGSNPYPSGMIIEGTAILTSKRINVLEHKIWNEPYNKRGDRFFFQTLAFNPKGGRYYFVLANVHAGHKVAHFEQAVRLREKLSQYAQTKNFGLEFGGFMVGGDFNSRLFRPGVVSEDDLSEVSAVPYEVAWPEVYDFNFLVDAASAQERQKNLSEELEALNKSSYKPWATIQNQTEAQERIQTSVERFKLWQQDMKAKKLTPFIAMGDSLWRANQAGLCSPWVLLKGSCHVPARIDYLFSSYNLEVLNSFILYSGNDWAETNSVSDHPGLLGVLRTD
jgi:hypothetical protein